jgi:hypothetical protein
MKKRLIEKSYQPFFTTALFAGIIALFFWLAHPGSTFTASIYDVDVAISNAKVWAIFSVYLFFLAAIYYTISKNNLKPKRWLLVSHYTFIVLFLVFFAVFSAFDSGDVQQLIKNIPLSVIITIYGSIFLADLIFFFTGIVLLLVNLFTLRKTQ